MKMITKAIEKKFGKFPFGSQEGKMDDAEVIFKVFNPYGAGTWLVTEAEREGDDWMFFGCVNLFGTWEWGYFSLRELESVRVPVFGSRYPLERDRWCSGTVGENIA